jgi:ATP adenylyltransferase
MTYGLRERIAEVSRTARAAGALQPVTARVEQVSEGGIDYLVHVLDGARRDAAPRPPGNPFLDPEPALRVEDTSPTHRLILNKYNVLDQHALLVTRAFEPQESALNLADFDAASRCLVRMDALVFYNAGRSAGASQGHKHLQLVPLPMSKGKRLPLDPGRDALPCRHAFARLPRYAAAEALAGYQALRSALGVGVAGYNLLLTRTWMLLVPRSQAEVEGVPVNALAFAGTLLARDEAGLAVIRRLGPAGVLRAAA